jgi:arabinose-5-phosphate isomerase
MNSDWLLIGKHTLEKEAGALKAFASELGESFVTTCEWIFACKGTVLLTGMGKSGIVARKWSSTFSSTGTKSYFINPAEAPHGDLGILRAGDLLIALSASGETEELGHILRHAVDSQIKRIGITTNSRSSFASDVDLILSVPVAQEACPLGLAPTTSTTLMMALGDALAVVLMKMRGWTEEKFARLHPAGALGRRLWLRVKELMHQGDEIPRVSPGAGFGDVLVEMTQKRLGLAVVMEKNRVVGIITDGDLRRFFQKKTVVPSAQAKDLMTTRPKCIHSGALAVEARRLMEENKIQHLLVIDELGNELSGVIHLHDLLRAKVV